MGKGDNKKTRKAKKTENLETAVLQKETATKSRRASSEKAPQKQILFSKENYTIIGIGLAIVVVGFMLMSGGAASSPDEWNADEIYSFRRITLAPLIILSGLGVIVAAIFKSSGSEDDLAASLKKND